MTHRHFWIGSVFLSATALTLVTGCPPGQAPTPGPGGIAAAREFRAELSGANEVPPVTTPATGSFEAELEQNETQIRFRLEAEDIVNVTVAHIHVGAVGTNGPIIFFLFNAATDGPFISPVTGTLTAADFIPAGGLSTFEDAIEAIKAGNTYANVHTVVNPNGEIRGQLVAQDQVLNE